MYNYIFAFIFLGLIIFNLFCIAKLVIIRIKEGNGTEVDNASQSSNSEHKFSVNNFQSHKQSSNIKFRDDEDEELSEEERIVAQAVANGKVISLFKNKNNANTKNDNNSSNQPQKSNEMQSVVDQLLEKSKQKKRKKFEVLGHILLWGPPGLGKTTLANVIANELRRKYQRNIRLITATPLDLRSKADLDAIIKNVNYGDVVFIDEIHGMNRTVEESLYSVLQDFQYSIKTEAGFQTIKVPRCTFIGATTLAGLLNRPLRERFNIEVELEPPTTTTIMKILRDQEVIDVPHYFDEYHGQEKAKELIKLHIQALGGDVEGITKSAQQAIAERSCNTPRIAKQLYYSARAKAIVSGHSEIDISDVEFALDLLGIDENGVQNAGQRIIRYLIERGNKPVGADNLADVARVSLADLKDMIEPKLIQLGLLERTKKGRILTEKALNLYKRFKTVVETETNVNYTS